LEKLDLKELIMNCNLCQSTKEYIRTNFGSEVDPNNLQVLLEKNRIKHKRVV